MEARWRPVKGSAEPGAETLKTAQRIRQHIADHGGSTTQQILEATQLHSTQCKRALWDMKRAGIVILTGTTYTLGRPPAPRERWDCQKERSRKTSEARRRRKGQKTKAEYLAEMAARTQESDARRIRAMAERVAKANAAKRAVAVRLGRRPFDQAIQPRTLQPTEAAPAKPVLMSSQEWERMGGKVQRLESNWQKPSGLRSPFLPFY